VQWRARPICVQTPHSCVPILQWRALAHPFAEPRGAEEETLEAFLKRFRVSAARTGANHLAKARKMRQAQPAAPAPATDDQGGEAAKPGAGPMRRRRACGAILFAVFRGKVGINKRKDLYCSDMPRYV